MSLYDPTMPQCKSRHPFNGVQCCHWDNHGGAHASWTDNTENGKYDSQWWDKNTCSLCGQFFFMHHSAQWCTPSWRKEIACMNIYKS